MLIKVSMPALSPTMTSGNIAKWIKSKGDKVKNGEVIAEIETDKATMEIESSDAGFIAAILQPEGAQGVKVNSLIAVLAEEERDLEELDAFITKYTITQNEPLPVDDKATDVTIDIEPDISNHILGSINANGCLSDGGHNNDRVFSSPLARRMAAEHKIDINKIAGSGPKKRVVKADILDYIRNNNSFSITGQSRRNVQEYELKPLGNIRKIIASRLLESKLQVPHFYLSVDCVADKMLGARARINENFNHGKISVNDFVILATAKAMVQVPEVNASWSADGIRQYNNIDISIAVAKDDGLITPIIRNADHKSLHSISAEMKELALRARANNLKPEEFQGGGLTISNLGMYGIDNFKAIINPPQSCIMAVGGTIKKPVVIEDKIQAAMVINISISCDHRVIDGAVAAKFLAEVKKYIEEPILMFV